MCIKCTVRTVTARNKLYCSHMLHTYACHELTKKLVHLGLARSQGRAHSVQRAARNQNAAKHAQPPITSLEHTHNTCKRPGLLRPGLCCILPPSPRAILPTIAACFSGQPKASSAHRDQRATWAQRRVPHAPQAAGAGGVAGGGGALPAEPRD